MKKLQKMDPDKLAEDLCTGIDWNDVPEDWHDRDRLPGDTDREKLPSDEDKLSSEGDILLIDDDILSSDGDILSSDGDKLANRDKLNDDQKKIFDYLMKHMQYEKENPEGLDSMKIFITGGAGTGKTFLLNLLYENIYEIFEEDVIIKTAFTGMAASHINGMTLHSTFKLHKAFPFDPVSKEKFKKYMTKEELKLLKHDFRFTKYLIIDEISMVSAEIFDQIDERLQYLLDSNKIFGGINVILFGDLLQLPPINGQPIYVSDLWQKFEFYELHQNMRQNDNRIFLNLLNNVRIGEVSNKDMNVMQHKRTNSSYNFGDNAIRVYPTNKLVQNYNDKILDHFIKKNEEIYTFEAVDRFPKNLMPKHINEIHGMPKTIKLFRGARVMLRKNLSVETNLVNGRIGTVTNCLPLNRRIEVQFDNDANSYEFGYKEFEEFDIIRSTLPFILCFACTVHKLQGCTLDKAVIYLGSQHFQAGQIYVALSRVRRLEDLEIETFDPSKFVRNELINWSDLKELERLRQLYKFR